ncbi:MAG: hypothetical protein F4246_07060, partial [Rhodothermaceae bacterium]|nr:hypothetical protein [Rhodothermaceae bacterium]
SLNLSNNQLTGSIPPELGNLTELWALHLHRNQLTGSIPPELGNLEALKRLDLRRNQLTGSIPRTFLQIHRLSRLYLHDNAGVCVPLDNQFQAWLYSSRTYGGYHRCASH